MRRAILVLACLLAASRAALAQEPAGPPPPTGTRGDGHVAYELLPDIGRIGAQVAAVAGPTWNPYGADTGYHLGGHVDLPLFRAAGGKVSYELLVDLSRANLEPSRTVRLLQLSPVGFRYTSLALDRRRLRPFLYGGFDYLVVFTRPVSGGEGPPSAETALELGGHAGGGLEVRVSRGVSLNLDYRYTGIEGGERLHTLSAALGLHW